MKHTRSIIIIFVIVLIGVTFAGSSFTKESDSPESWEGWEDIFLNPEKKDWKLKKNKKGIKAYTRPVEISPVDSFRGEIELDTDIQTLLGIFMDIPSYASLILLCTSIEVVKQVDETSQYLYTTNKVVWPVKTRDNACFSKWFYNPETGSVCLRLKTKPDFVPRNKKYIRVEIMTGYFKFTPNTNGKVDVVFEAIVEVGGWVPAWIIRFYQPEIPYITLRRLEKEVTLEKYKGFFFDYMEKFEKTGSPLQKLGSTRNH
jgi:hypothetical protein